MKFSNARWIVDDYKKCFKFCIKKKLFKTILILLFISPVATKSQQATPPDSLLNKLTGEWILEGTIEGKETVHDVDVKRVLNGQYIQLNEVSREKGEKGNPLYEAIIYIYWQEAKQQYACLWLDNNG